MYMQLIYGTSLPPLSGSLLFTDSRINGGDCVDNLNSLCPFDIFHLTLPEASGCSAATSSYLWRPHRHSKPSLQRQTEMKTRMKHVMSQLMTERLHLRLQLQFSTKFHVTSVGRPVHSHHAAVLTLGICSSDKWL